MYKKRFDSKSGKISKKKLVSIKRKSVKPYVPPTIQEIIMSQNFIQLLKWKKNDGTRIKLVKLPAYYNTRFQLTHFAYATNFDEGCTAILDQVEILYSKVANLPKTIILSVNWKELPEHTATIYIIPNGVGGQPWFIVDAGADKI